MTRVLHLLDHSLPLQSGYCFRTRAILRAQQQAGLEVAGLTGVRQQHGVKGAGALAESAQNNTMGLPSETVDGLRFFRTAGDLSGLSPIREWREIAALARQAENVAREWQADIIHAHSPALTGMAGARAAQALGLPFVYEIRAFWEDAAVGNGTGQDRSAKYWLTRQLENYVVGRADAVAVICEGLRGDLVQRGFDEKKIFVSPNGVDNDLFGQSIKADAALRESLGLGHGPVIGFIGSFYDYEGLDDLICAMPLLLASVPDARLLMVGGGPKEEALKAQAAASGVSSAICFTGRVPHAQVERYYALIDILAYPRKAMRLTELVTPLKPLEAMAQRRLVAASSVGGHKEMIRDGDTGTLFAPDDPGACAAALAKIIARRDDWEKQRDRAELYVREERNWMVNVQRYLPVYQKLLTIHPREKGRRAA